MAGWREARQASTARQKVVEYRVGKRSYDGEVDKNRAFSRQETMHSQCAESARRERMLGALEMVEDERGGMRTRAVGDRKGTRAAGFSSAPLVCVGISASATGPARFLGLA